MLTYFSCGIELPRRVLVEQQCVNMAVNCCVYMCRLGHVGRADDGRVARWRRARLGPVVVRDAARVAAARPAPCVAANAPSQVYQVSATYNSYLPGYQSVSGLVYL